jgi:hypothetical protein
MKPENAPIPILKPCPKAWENMAGTEKKRFCEVCQLHVHNLSAMNTKERETVMSRPGGPPCIAYELRPDGGMVTPSRWARLPFYRAGLSAAAALAAAFPMLFSSCASSRRSTGGVPMPPPTEAGKNPVLLGEYDSGAASTGAGGGQAKTTPAGTSGPMMLGTPMVKGRPTVMGGPAAKAAD